MYLKLQNKLKKDDINRVISEIEKLNFKFKNISTKEQNIIYVYCTKSDINLFDNIEGIIQITDTIPNRYTNKLNDVVEIKVKDIVINKDNFTIIAGPCSVETTKQMNVISKEIESNIHILRGGAYKPRTSPYQFQGLKEEGIDMLKNVCGSKPIISEITSIDDIDCFVENVDIIQVGTRNMQNFDLLSKLGKTNKPIMLKRGFANTIEEWLLAAEYIIKEGNKNVILCERGIRTFENFTRNTLDLSAVVAVKEISNLLVFVDPSHASGKWWMIDKLSKAAMACGADGLMIEVHNDPDNALSDGPQSIKPVDFNKLVEELKVLAPMFNKRID